MTFNFSIIRNRPARIGNTRSGLWVLLFLSLRLLGQPVNQVVSTDTLTLNFKLINAKDGLSQGLIKGIVQDPEGFMWFATGDGLNRYDGYQMKVYRPNPADPYSLPENSLTGVELDSNGNFWIATASQGLWRMDRKTERFQCFRSSGISGGTISSIQRVDGWLLVAGRGMAELLDVRLVGPETTSCPGFSVATPSESEQYNLFPGGVVRSRNITTGFISNWVRAGHFLKKGEEIFHRQSLNFSNNGNWCYNSFSHTVWVISDEMLFRMEGDRKPVFHMALPKSLVNQYVMIYPWAADQLLIQSFPEGLLWMIDTKKRKVSRVLSNQAKRAPVTLTYLDRAGNHWLGTGGEGISVLMKGSRKFQTWTRDKFIYQIATSPKQEVVFCDQVETIRVDLQKGTRRTRKFPSGKRLESMKPIVFAPSGNVWISFTINEQGTLLVSDQAGIKPMVLPPMKDKSWSGEPLLFIDSRNYLWRIESGENNQRFLRKINLDQMEDETTFLVPASPLLHPMPFLSDFKVIGNCLWLGTTQGLFCFNMQTEKWEKQHRHQKGNPGSLSDDVVLSLCPDPVEPSRFLWVGTHGGGLCKVGLSTGISRNYAMKDGLPNQTVYGILSDEFHNLWLSTNKGLCCFTPPGSQKEKPVCCNFTTEDGLANDEFNRYSYTKMADGTLVFGGTHGLTWFSPKEVLAVGNPPQMSITGFSIFNTPVDYKSDSTVVNEPFPFAKLVNLNHEQGMFRIEFASLDFGPNSKKQYSYFLEGYDKRWIPGGTINSATYTNLSPGDYIFRVKGTNTDGVWSKEEASVIICISPPWWATWWFRTLAVLSVCGLVYGVYRYQLNQAIKVVKLRNRIALDLHDEIGSTLNSIAFFGEVANQMMEEDDKAKPVLSRMSIHAKEVVDSMSDIVWSLNSKNDSFEQLVDRLQSFATQMLEPKGCLVEFQRPEKIGEIKLDMEQRRNLYLIVKEAINNAAKYAEATTLWVYFNYSGNKLEIEIGDNGQGFDPQTVANGNGLESMEGRAKSMGAKWRIKSGTGKGTQIFLDIKI